jgi:DNA-binding NarL/FixJ family response regulator
MNEIVKAALTPAQLRVAEALLDGLGNREIAARIGVTERNVKARLQLLFLKFQVVPLGEEREKRILLARKLLCV